MGQGLLDQKAIGDVEPHLPLVMLKDQLFNICYKLLSTYKKLAFSWGHLFQILSQGLKRVAPINKASQADLLEYMHMPEVGNFQINMSILQPLFAKQHLNKATTGLGIQSEQAHSMHI